MIIIKRTSTTLIVRKEGFTNGEYDEKDILYMTSIEDCPETFENMSSKSDSILIDWVVNNCQNYIDTFTKNDSYSHSGLKKYIYCSNYHDVKNESERTVISEKSDFVNIQVYKNCYGSSFKYLNSLVEEIKKDFPNVDEEEIRFVQYDGSFKKCVWGVLARVKKEDYLEIPKGVYSLSPKNSFYQETLTIG